MVDRYPPVEPYATGFLPVTDGNHLYWESVGSPDGLPVVYLHGGPGGGTSPGVRRYFDPMAYRAVLFDQRGCGRSVPLAVSPDVDLDTNTTPTWSGTSRHCASIWASTAGSCSASPGG